MIKRLCSDAVECQCRQCGAIAVYPLDTLTAGEANVVFPWCSACHETRFSVQIVPGPITKTTANAQLRQRAVKALHQQLVRRGRLAATVDRAALPADLHDGALEWPVGDAVCDIPIPTWAVVK